MLNPLKKIFLFSADKRGKILLIAGLFLFSDLKGQKQDKGKYPVVLGSSTIPDDTTAHRKYVAIKDLFDIVRSFSKKESSTTGVSDTFSSKPIYSVVPAIGYTLQTKLAAVISGNVAFRTAPQAKLSTITASSTYTQNRQFFIPVLSNISIKDNRYKLIGDLRFYKYPQSTFGLGSDAPIENEDPMNYDYFRLYETVLRQIKGNLYVGAGYNLDRHWRISHKGNLNGTESDYAKYESVKQTTSSGITINGLYDSRDNPINAGKGFYTSVQLRNNLKAIGSNTNWRSVIIDARKYLTFPGKSNNIIAFWSYNAFVIDGKPPYLDLPSTGWDNYNATGRGFIQGRYRGSKMVYLEMEYRFKITVNGLLGGVLYINEQAFSGVAGSSLQSFQKGYGTGLRIKLNKKSDTNLAIDYAFGTQGSKGLFITVGELF